MNRLGMWFKQSTPLNENQMYSAQIVIEVDKPGTARCLKNTHGVTGTIDET